MLLSEAARAFSGPGWAFEIQYDGWRCLPQVKGGVAQLQSRGGADETAWWPEVANALAEISGHHVLDGKMCVLDDLGRSSFEKLQKRSMLKRWKMGTDPVVFCAFDRSSWTA